MKITGTVLNAMNNETIASASLEVLDPSGKATGVGTIADSAGKFTLDSVLLDKPGYKVSVSAIGGFQTEKIIPKSGNVYLAQIGDLLGVVYVTAKNLSNKKSIFELLIHVSFIVLAIYLSKKLNS